MLIDQFINFIGRVETMGGNPAALIYNGYRECSVNDRPYFAAIVSGNHDTDWVDTCPGRRRTTLEQLYSLLCRRDAQSHAAGCSCARGLDLPALARLSWRWPVARASCAIEWGRVVVGSLTTCPSTDHERAVGNVSISGQVMQLHIWDGQSALLVDAGGADGYTLIARQTALALAQHHTTVIANCFVTKLQLVIFDLLWLDRDVRAMPTVERIKLLGLLGHHSAQVVFGRPECTSRKLGKGPRIYFDDNFLYTNPTPGPRR